MLNFIIIAVLTTGAALFSMPFLGPLGGASFGVISVALGAIIFRLLSARCTEPSAGLRITSAIISVVIAEILWYVAGIYPIVEAGESYGGDGGMYAMLAFWLLSSILVAVFSAVFGAGVGQLPKGR